MCEQNFLNKNKSELPFVQQVAFKAQIPLPFGPQTAPGFVHKVG